MRTARAIAMTIDAFIETHEAKCGLVLLFLAGVYAGIAFALIWIV
jgi:hypothetical protein